MEIPNLSECILQNLEPTSSSEIPIEVKEAAKQLAVNRNLFTWLWGLDEDVVREKSRDGSSWGWDILREKLSQAQIHEPATQL